MNFDWDEMKNAINLAKHGISFSVAARVFEDDHHVMKLDRNVDGEERYKTLGLIEGSVLLVVAHLYEAEDGEEYVRIISARMAEASERRSYEEGD